MAASIPSARRREGRARVNWRWKNLRRRELQRNKFTSSLTQPSPQGEGFGVRRVLGNTRGWIRAPVHRQPASVIGKVLSPGERI